MTTQRALEIGSAKTIKTSFDYYIETIEGICKSVSQTDILLLEPETSDQFLKCSDSDWDDFARSWNDLKEDRYMADGGKYRERRHTTLSAFPSSCVWVKEPHQPHYQSLHYNGLNGDVARHYEPIQDEIANNRAFKSVINLGCEIFGRLSPFHMWHIEAHQFRIKASVQIPGSPTPEGIHRDGVNYVLMMLIDRENVTGGKTTVYNAEKNKIDEITLTRPKSIALVNDERTYHGVSPIYLDDVNKQGYRDMLVVTFCKKIVDRGLTE